MHYNPYTTNILTNAEALALSGERDLPVVRWLMPNMYQWAPIEGSWDWHVFEVTSHGGEIHTSFEPHLFSLAAIRQTLIDIGAEQAYRNTQNTQEG